MQFSPQSGNETVRTSSDAKGGEDMKKESYAGMIGNQGAQKIEAPIQPKADKGKRTVHKGKDLRAGK